MAAHAGAHDWGNWLHEGAWAICTRATTVHADVQHPPVIAGAASGVSMKPGGAGMGGKYGVPQMVPLSQATGPTLPLAEHVVLSVGSTCRDDGRWGGGQRRTNKIGDRRNNV